MAWRMGHGVWGMVPNMTTAIAVATSGTDIPASLAPPPPLLPRSSCPNQYDCCHRM
jgi:hypothetical protein